MIVPTTRDVSMMIVSTGADRVQWPASVCFHYNHFHGKRTTFLSIFLKKADFIFGKTLQINSLSVFA